MSKRGNRKLKQTPIVTDSTSKKAYNVWNKVFGIIAPILLIYSLLPDISIVPSASLEPNNPFSAPFSIVNASKFDIHKVTVSFIFDDMSATTVRTKLIMKDSSIIEQEVDTIESGKSITKFVRINMPSGKLEKANIQVEVKYKYWILPKIFTYSRKYSSFQASNNTVTWLSK